MWGGAAEEMVDTPFTDYVHPAHLGTIVDHYERNTAGEERAPMLETVLRRRDGSDMPAELNTAFISYGGGPAELVIVRDVTERKRTEEGIRRRNEQLAALNAISTTVSGSLDLQEILDRALNKVLELAGTQVGSIYLLNQRAGELTLASHRGVSDEFAEQVRTLRVDASVSGQAAQCGEPMVVDDVTNDPRMTGTPVSRTDIRAFVAIPVKAREEVLGVMHVASHERHAVDPGEVRLYTTIAHQIGLAVQNAQLWDAAQRRLGESSILLEISQAITSVVDLEELLQLIVDSALDAIECAEGGVVYLLDEHGKDLWPRAWAGGHVAATRLMEAQGMQGCQEIAERAARQGRVINAPDIEADPRFAAPEGTHEFRSLLAVPLLVDRQGMGCVAITSGRVGAFTTEDERLMMALASQAAIAVENAQLLARSEALAVLSERHRIASDIHDGVAQNLASVAMRADLGLGLMDSDPREAKQILTTIRVSVRENIQELRRLIFALRPVALEELGFLPALRKYASGFEEQNELAVHMSIRGEDALDRLSPVCEYALFLVLQEALNNVRKHASARNVWITFDPADPGGVSLLVSDDGLGFDRAAVRAADPTRSDGFGLSNMGRRVEALGGRLAIEAAPGSGTKITAVIPPHRGRAR
jgi:PAS domain S-box-containing protein